MHILLLGATGQIGYSLARALAQMSYQLSVLVRDRSKRLFPQTVKVLESRSLDAQALRQALSGIDHVIYSVGLPEQYVPDSDVFERVNLDLLKTFLGILTRRGQGGR